MTQVKTITRANTITAVLFAHILVVFVFVYSLWFSEGAWSWSDGDLWWQMREVCHWRLTVHVSHQVCPLLSLALYLGFIWYSKSRFNVWQWWQMRDVLLDLFNSGCFRSSVRSGERRGWSRSKSERWELFLLLGITYLLTLVTLIRRELSLTPPRRPFPTDKDLGWKGANEK